VAGSYRLDLVARMTLGDCGPFEGFIRSVDPEMCRTLDLASIDAFDCAACFLAPLVAEESTRSRSFVMVAISGLAEAFNASPH
jgi:hypothetical protein